MKKVISMLLFVAAAAFTTSCDVEDIVDDLVDDYVEDALDDLLGNETDGMTEYAGEVSVSNGFSSNTSFFLEEEDDTLTIVMQSIQFSSAMPTMDITLCNIATSEGEFSADSAETIVVMYNTVVSSDAYPVTNVVGSYDESDLTISFTCTANGSNFDIEFTGSAE